MENQQFSTLYIDLDTLFDTRLATLYENLTEVDFKKELKKYYTRIDDDFYPWFKDKYDNRNKNILANSSLTKIIDLVKEFIKVTYESSRFTPFQFKPKIHLNIYPYELLEEEINVLIAGLVTITNEICDIEIINKSFKDLNPGYVKSTYSVMYMYHYRDWLDENITNNKFEKITCHEITLIGPALLYCDNEKKKLLIDKNQIKDDVISFLETDLAKIIKIKLIPINNFCIGFELDKLV